MSGSSSKRKENWVAWEDARNEDGQRQQQLRDRIQYLQFQRRDRVQSLQRAETRIAPLKRFSYAFHCQHGDFLVLCVAFALVAIRSRSRSVQAQVQVQVQVQVQAQDGPRWTYDGPKTSQERHKMSQEYRKYWSMATALIFDASEVPRHLSKRI